MRRSGQFFLTTAFDPGGDTWSVLAEPGDYVAFSPPWDLGDYDA